MYDVSQHSTLTALARTPLQGELTEGGKTPRKIEQTIDPSVGTETEPLRLVNGMPALDYCRYGAELMKRTPPRRPPAPPVPSRHRGQAD